MVNRSYMTPKPSEAEIETAKRCHLTKHAHFIRQCFIRCINQQTMVIQTKRKTSTSNENRSFLTTILSFIWADDACM